MISGEFIQAFQVGRSNGGVTDVVIKRVSTVCGYKYRVFDSCGEGHTRDGFSFDEVHDDLWQAWSAAAQWASVIRSLDYVDYDNTKQVEKEAEPCQN